MKFSVVLFFVILSFNLFGQDGDKYYSINTNKEKLEIFKQNGDYSVQLLDNYTDEIVKTNSKYYSMYFSVEFDEVKKELNEADGSYSVARADKCLARILFV